MAQGARVPGFGVSSLGLQALGQNAKPSFKKKAPSAIPYGLNLRFRHAAQKKTIPEAKPDSGGLRQV